MKKLVKNSNLQFFTIVILFLTLLVTFWNAHETRKLVSYQIKEDVYFDVKSNEIFPRSYIRDTQYLRLTSFKDNPLLQIDIINKGFKSIKITDIITTGDCLNNIRFSLFNEGTILKEGEFHLFETDLLKHYLNSSKTCELKFILKTENSEYYDFIILEVEE
jgi:hypothetical protein